MPNVSPVTSPLKPDPVDDGWFLDEDPDQYYAEYVIKEAPPNRGPMYRFVYGSVAPRLKRPS